MKRGWLIAVLAGSLVIPLVLVAHEVVVVDQCLDHGGSFDYGTGRCDFVTVSHPVIPFASRHRLTLTGSAVAALLSLGILIRQRRDGAVA